jgi:hypothetical protein
MGYFMHGPRWDMNILNRRVNPLRGFKDFRFTKKERDAIIKRHAQTPEKALLELQQQLNEKMKKCGKQKEQEWFNLVWDDLRNVLPIRLSKRKLLHSANLLIDVIFLWATGKALEGREDTERFEEKLRSLHLDPEANRLFHLADEIFEIVNERARDMQGFLEKYHSKRIFMRGKKVQARKVANVDIDDSLKAMVENAQTITYNEALRQANSGGIIPANEFDLREIDLQSAYREFRSRMRKRSNKSNTLLPTKS